MMLVILLYKMPSKLWEIALARFQNLKIFRGSIAPDPLRLIPSQQQSRFELDPPLEPLRGSRGTALG